MGSPLPSPTSPRPPRAGQSRTEQIAAVLRDEILAGQYRAGERLPSERDLAVRFDTGRGTVREAFKKLEQLGVATIQPGGARVVPVERCTLDVLGPLLDLNDTPDPELVDQVLQIFGMLLELAATSALEKASAEDLRRAQQIIGEMESSDADNVRQHAALRRLAELFVDVADHLVLRLTLNGLRTTFFARMQAREVRPELDSSVFRDLAKSLSRAIERRDVAAVCDSMRRLNRSIRTSARQALLPKAQETEQRDNERMSP
jgi:GntR family transcriptional repressor for pyruvate dehydrogenase complex